MDIQSLNALYAPLDTRSQALLSLLREAFPRTTQGWYNGHYAKNAEGEYELHHFPIPEVNVKGLCDVELHFDAVYISSKLHRTHALAFNYELLQNVPFEAYGVEDYLKDFYLPGMTHEQLISAIIASSEREIGFSFRFPTDTLDADLIDFIQLLHFEGFHN